MWSIVDLPCKNLISLLLHHIVLNYCWVQQKRFYLPDWKMKFPNDCYRLKDSVVSCIWHYYPFSLFSWNCLILQVCITSSWFFLQVPYSALNNSIDSLFVPDTLLFSTSYFKSNTGFNRHWNVFCIYLGHHPSAHCCVYTL